jgi:hypothetical protein
MARSAAEIQFRLAQEAANLRLAFGPGRKAPPTTSLPLPNPDLFLDRLRGTAYAEKLLGYADDILGRQLPLLGISIQTDREIRWRRDYLAKIETDTRYFRRIPYLDASRVGDHKLIWELNRHQHLVTLAQAFLLSGRQEYLDDLWGQLRSWMHQNPLARGMNWTSALEVAFRALSWVWIEHLAGKRMPDDLRTSWLGALHDHGRYLGANLSIYFSPNTHLQGEALALHALGMLFGSDPWQTRGAGILDEIIQTHVRPDGGHFEQSTYYHVYALDMFLFHALLRPVSEAYRDRLRKMAAYLWAIASSGEIPMMGDDDGGRLFYPYGVRRRFSRGTLATCAAFLGDTLWHGNSEDLYDHAYWWLGPVSPRPHASMPACEHFNDSGLTVFNSGDIQIVIDSKAFGFGGAGHSHAHALHFTLTRAGSDVLIDPGTYTYVADAAARDQFRSTAAHNTVRIDRHDQADPAGPFRWTNLPQTQVRHASDRGFSADCSYRGLRHTRQMRWSGGVLFVLDSFEGDGNHLLEQHWHAGGPVRSLTPDLLELPCGVRLALPAGSAVTLEDGWYSPAPGAKEPRPVIRVSLEARFPAVLAAAFLFSDDDSPVQLELAQSPAQITLTCAGRREVFGGRPPACGGLPPRPPGPPSDTPRAD